jgi:hypothetical protein
MSTPSIALIPSGYKEGLLYSQLPINGDGDLTFSRPGISGVPNATRVNEQGLIENVNADVPRLDYSDGGCPVLLLEPSATNLIPNSNEVVGIGAGVVDLNNSISPDGTQDALKVTFGSSTNDGARFSPFNSACLPSTEYTFSFYAKILIGDGTFKVRIDTDGAIGTNQDFTATNEWVLYQYTFTTDASANNFINTSRLRPDTANNEVLFYEFQLELGTVATSRIKTSGGVATRTQDTANKSGLENYINSQEGVFYAEIKALSELGGNRYITLSDGTSANRIILKLQDIDKINIFIGNSNGGSDSFNYDNANISTQFNKVAIKWKQDEVSFWVNGSKIDSVALFNTFTDSTLNTLIFSGSSGNSSLFQGKVKDLRVYTTALTDQELTELTTI